VAPQTGDRYRIPVPKRDVELKARGSGPVTTYYLSPEEIQAKYGPPVPAKLGVRDRLAVFDQRRQIAKTMKEEKRMIAQLQDGQRVASAAPSKIEFLRQIAAGKTISKIEREWNMTPGSLYYWVGKWNLKGIKPDRAKQLLDEMKLDGELPEQKPAEINLSEAIEATAEKLFNAAPVAIDQEADPAARIIAAEVELHRQKDEKIERLTRELEAKAARINELEKVVNELEMKLADVRIERDALLQTVEKTVDADVTGHDPVNHPAHYTAGRIEYIDAIESATVGLSGGLAYCTGAAIKYLWRWSRKNGVEDLKKARWYIDRLIQEVGNGVQTQ
jgi:hypothetical protein